MGTENGLNWSIYNPSTIYDSESLKRTLQVTKKPVTLEGDGLNNL